MILFILLTNLIIHVRIDGKIIETFEHNGDNNVEFFIVGKRVPWSRAKLSCSNYDNEFDTNSKSQLASLENETIQNWLAKMLADSDNRYDELWVDAKRNSINSSWTWTESNTTINNSIILENKQNWYKGHQKTQENCLTFARRGHDLPSLSSSDCHEGKPFLCIRTKKEKSKIVEGISVYVDGYNYTLYGVDGQTIDEANFVSTGVGKINGGGVKWINARLECRKRGQHLAMILSNEAALVIANAMLRSRPSLENAWLGGHSEDGKTWVWSGTDQLLPSKKSKTTNYPPWLTNHPRSISAIDEFSETKSSCLVLDRHLCPENISPVFLDIDCEKKRPFICQHDVPEMSSHNNIARSIQQASSILEFSIEKMTWQEGKNYCKKNNGKVATIFDDETLFNVLKRMTELHLEHVWIGGKTEATSDPSVWKWMDEDGRELSRNQLGGSVSWCLGTDQNSFFKPEPNYCLNLDREAHGLPLFYGLPCESTRQRVICQIPKTETSTILSTTDDTLHVNTDVSKNHTIVIEEEINHENKTNINEDS
ncbi:macrophage mannose receptor 1-like isoform X2 [Aphidius gifuensis]|uniref:macrophage mannose receptor 1-like isoform X2 n=1 Tax=Aphidius gifuensis TaxID=684658 RepID=UPI001CDD7F5E|nr:macrophage mannose receptor 1-like isoform X2 [Aphidius gifuensis]